MVTERRGRSRETSEDFLPEPGDLQVVWGQEEEGKEGIGVQQEKYRLRRLTAGVWIPGHSLCER